jgi:hypothetical protein
LRAHPSYASQALGTGSRHRRRYGRHYRCVYHQCVFPTLRSTGLVWPTDRRIHMCELLTPTRPARMRAHINKQHINLDPLASHLSPVSGALVWLGVRGGAGNGPSVVGRAERGGGRDQKGGGGRKKKERGKSTNVFRNSQIICLQDTQPQNLTRTSRSAGCRCALSQAQSPNPARPLCTEPRTFAHRSRAPKSERS